MKPTSPDTLASIRVRLARGESCRQIAASLGVAKSTVGKFRQTLPEDTPKAKSGTRPKLTDRDKTLVVTWIKRFEAKTAVEAAKLFNKDVPDEKKVSAETIRRALKASGLKAVLNKKRPALKPHHHGRQNKIAWERE